VINGHPNQDNSRMTQVSKGEGWLKQSGPVPKPLIIYLADPTHDGSGRISTEIMPYNIGLIAAYAKKILGDAVEIKLFKYVQPLIDSIKDRPPDIFGSSHYMWNSRLSEFLCKVAKRENKKVLTVQGGTNYPFDEAGQLELLSQRPNVDFHTVYEGEQAFVNLVLAFQECSEVSELRELPIPGVQSVSPTTGYLISGPPVPRMKTLDEVPSPYLMGLMDDFFDGVLVPLLETNRGCPFSCNFCNAGATYFNNVNKYSIDYLKAEWSYIAPRAAEAGTTTCILADNNFGMYSRDADLCVHFKELQDEFGWPQRIMATTGKNNRETIIKTTEILGTALSMNMSAQSMDSQVLKNIKRENISLKVSKEINESLLKQGRIQKGELISCLPGESYQSFMNGLKEMIETGTQQIYNFQLELLYGTPYKDPEYRKEWGYKGLYRLVSYNFGEYDNTRIFDIEEVAVTTNTFSFDDYLKIRLVCLFTESMYNEYQYYEIVKYLREHGISPFDWLVKTLDNIERAPKGIREVIDSFLEDTQNELFETEEELIDLYSQEDNYQKLARGELGHNVVFTHKGLLISQHLNEWITFISEMCLETIFETLSGEINTTKIHHEMDQIQQYVIAKWRGVLNSTVNTDEVILMLDYDMLSWLNDESSRKLSDFKKTEPLSFRFFFKNTQKKRREEDMRRYGYDKVGLARLYSRGIQYDLFRHVELNEGHPAAPTPPAPRAWVNY
jgi:radical SAM superfamily enzyme YgiQ (UPF0313 family)